MASDATAPLDILLVTHGLPPDSVGGVEQHVQGLARALRTAGHRVEIFARSSVDRLAGSPQGSLHTEDRDDGRVTRAVYRWEGITNMRGLYRVELMEQALRTFLDARPKKFDVAHVHHLTGLSTGAVSVLRDAGIPVVLTLHDYWIMCPRGQMWHREEHPCETVEPTQCAACLAPTFPQWLPTEAGAPTAAAVAEVAAIHQQARETLRAADVLVTPSARTIPFFARLGIPAESIGVVENGVDTEGLAAVPRPETTGPLRVGYFGTLIPSKGLDVLCDAFQQAFPHAKVTGAATLQVHGNYVPYHGDTTFLQRTLEALPADAGATYHGSYQTFDLPRRLAGIDVLVAPALWHEAFGLTVREAQAAGRAVVVSRIGGVQDAVADGVEGRLVEPGDRAGLAAVLRELADDRAATAAMGAAGRRRIRGFAAMAADLVGHYRRAAGRGRA